MPLQHPRPGRPPPAPGPARSHTEPPRAARPPPALGPGRASRLRGGKLPSPLDKGESVAVAAQALLSDLPWGPCDGECPHLARVSGFRAVRGSADCVL